MPSAALKGLARKHGVDLATVEGYWAEARKEYGDDFRAVMGTVTKRLKNHVRARARAATGK